MSNIILYVLRHGKTKANEERLYCGYTDISLSDIGIMEVNKLKKNLRYPICRANFTSGAKRANETFNLIYGHNNFIEVKELFEYNFGEFEMKSYEMLKENSEYIKWILDKGNEVKCTKGESRKEFHCRISEGLHKVIDNMKEMGEKEGVLLCHGGTIGTLLELYGMTNKNYYELQPSYGRGYKLKVFSEGTNIKIEILEEF